MTKTHIFQSALNRSLNDLQYNDSIDVVECKLNGRIGNEMLSIFTTFLFCLQHKIPFSKIRIDRNSGFLDCYTDKEKNYLDATYFRDNIQMFQNISRNIIDFDAQHEKDLNLYKAKGQYICLSYNASNPNASTTFEGIDFSKYKYIAIEYFDCRLSRIENLSYEQLLMFNTLFYNKALFDDISIQVLSKFKKRYQSLVGYSIRCGKDFKEFCPGCIYSPAKIYKEVSQNFSDDGSQLLCIFSDDIEEAKTIIQPQFHNVVFFQQTFPWKDMIALSMCDVVLGNVHSQFINCAKLLNHVRKMPIGTREIAMDVLESSQKINYIPPKKIKVKLNVALFGNLTMYYDIFIQNLTFAQKYNNINAYNIEYHFCLYCNDIVIENLNAFLRILDHPIKNIRDFKYLTIDTLENRKVNWLLYRFYKINDPQFDLCMPFECDNVLSSFSDSLAAYCRSIKYDNEKCICYIQQAISVKQYFIFYSRVVNAQHYIWNSSHIVSDQKINVFFDLLNTVIDQKLDYSHHYIQSDELVPVFFLIVLCRKMLAMSTDKCIKFCSHSKAPGIQYPWLFEMCKGAIKLDTSYSDVLSTFSSENGRSHTRIIDYIQKKLYSEMDIQCIEQHGISAKGKIAHPLLQKVMPLCGTPDMSKSLYSYYNKAFGETFTLDYDVIRQFQ